MSKNLLKEFILNNDDLYIFLYIDNIPGTLYDGTIASSVLIFLLTILQEEEYQDWDM